MKILNSTTRDAIDDLIKTPISGLVSTSELPDQSLLLTAVPDGDGYQSKKITAKTFNNKVYEAIENTYKTGYWNLQMGVSSTNDSWNLHSETSPYKEMIDYINILQKYYPANIESVPEEPLPYDDDTKKSHSFYEHINYDFELLRRYTAAKDYELQLEINDIITNLSEIDGYFAKSMLLTTSYEDSEGVIHDDSHISNFHSKNDNSTYCQMSIDDGNKISNEWTVPATGNLVIVGWLDSEDALSNKAIPTSYCVIEGKITSKANGTEWEIIGVQPVIPAKTFTYVGFNLLVHKDLVIRARCGFTVGGKSGQFSNEQDGYDTLSNSTPNGFKCQVYSRYIDE